MYARIALLVALMCALPGMCAAQDSDGDGIPDQIESRLGTNPDLDEELQLVIDDGLRGKTDRSGRGPTAPDVDKVYFAHVGGDRYVWKVTFAADYPQTNTIFHLYTDIDDDKSTGRQENDHVRGVDVMYSMIDSRNDPRIIVPAVRVDSFMPVRYVVSGNTIYVCDDVKMSTHEGKTHFRMWVLSQVRTQQSDSDSTATIYVDAPLHPDRSAPRVPYLRPDNFDSIAMRNFNELTYNLWHDERTVCLRAEDAAVTGYTVLMNDEFVSTGEGPASAIWQSPAAGDYHVGLILSDAPGRIEGVDVLVGADKVGTLVGGSAAKRDVLHYSQRPVSIQPGQSIQIRTAKKSGPVRLHSVCLLAEPPQVPPLRIENLTAWHMPDEPGALPGRVMIAWTTNRPAQANVSYSLAGPEAFVQSGSIPEDRGHVNNHFIILPPELRAMGYQLSIMCREAQQSDYEAQTATAAYTVWMDPAQHARQNGEPTPEAPTPTSIPLTVHEPTDAPRRQWPVSSGIPLPKGLLTDPASCRLLDGSGAAVPAQFRALSWWPDGMSVRWLLVDFLADTRSDRDAGYTLECGTDAPSPPPARPVVVKPMGLDARLGGPIGLAHLPLTIDTGPLQLSLELGGFAPFAAATLNGRRVSEGDPGRAGFELTDDSGVVYSSAFTPPDEVIIEDAGPLKATVCVKGGLANAEGQGYMRYVCRLHFYAGMPWVRTVFSLDNDVVAPDMNLIRSLQVRVPAALAGAQVIYGADGEAKRMQVPTRLLQDEDHRYRAGETGGKRADGWFVAGPEDISIGVAVRDFWQLYPKGYAADAEGVIIQLLPSLPRDQYADASEDDVNKLYFWCDEGRYKIRTGVRLSTEFAVGFGADTAPEAAVAQGARWQSPLFAAAEPQWYCQSGAFGPMIPRQEGKFDIYEKRLDGAFAKFIQRRETVREYGFMNYGDWFGERTWNWGNIEYDTQWALAVNFARTGNLDMLHRAEEAEWHNADVDTTHYWPRASDVGRVFTHCIGHTGGYFDRDWKGMGWFNTGPRTAGHTWAQGHFYIYGLLGEARYLETGRKVADCIARNTTDFRFNSERSAGWPITAVLGAYNVTGNPVYLNAAKLMADQAIWAVHRDKGHWGHFLDPAECKHDPRCWGCKPFMTGVLLHGLKMYHLAQPREDIAATIRNVSDFMWRVTYLPQDQGFYYSGCKTFRVKGSTWTISLVGDGLGYGVLLDPEHSHKDKLLSATAAYMHRSGVSDFGKGFTQGSCFMPQMLHDLDALGLTSIPEPPEQTAEDTVQLRETIFLVPGERRMIRPIIHHGGPNAVDCAISPRGQGADWFDLSPRGQRWSAAPGATAGPAIVVRAPKDAPANASQRLNVRVSIGDTSHKFSVQAMVAGPAGLGSEIAWITGDNDPFRLAAEALGVAPEPLADVGTAELARYGALCIGAEAFTKDFAGVRSAGPRLERWVVSGGRLIVGQLNDDGWSPSMLPLDIVLSEEEDECDQVTQPDHPLFSHPHVIPSLSGVVSYDSIVYADPSWNVLATNALGGPAILQATVGAGSVVVILPSFDRPVTGLLNTDEATRSRATAFIRNVLTYAGYQIKGS